MKYLELNLDKFHLMYLELFELMVGENLRYRSSITISEEDKDLFLDGFSQECRNIAQSLLTDTEDTTNLIVLPKPIQKPMDKIKPPIIEKLNKLSGKKIILDVGTQDGNDSIEFVENIQNSISYAFEGDPRAKLIEHPKVTYINKAVGNINGKMSWYASSTKDDTDYHGSSSLKKPKLHLDIHPSILYNKTEVDCIRLDDWVQENNIPIVHLLWLDVNGGEREFFEGAMDTLLNKTMILITEWFSTEFFEGQITVKEIQKILQNKFRVYQYSNNLVSLINLKF